MHTVFAQSILEAGGIPFLTRGAGILELARVRAPRAPRPAWRKRTACSPRRRRLARARRKKRERASEERVQARRAQPVLTPDTYAVRYPRSMAMEPDDSEDFDLVTVFSSDEHNAEMQAQAVQNVLEAGGIPAVIVGSSVLPNLPFEVRVPSSRLEEAQTLIADSEAAGPAGAEEAERASEEPR